MNVYFLSMKKETPKNHYWDYGFLNDFIAGNVWRPPGFPDFKTHEVDKLPTKDTAIVIIPARHHADMAYEINKELKKIKHAVLFLMGDEEADFPVEEIKHKSIYIWVQNPHPGRHDQYNKLGTTYPLQSQEILPKLKPDKTTDIFFAGQITHSRRLDMQTCLNEYKKKYNDNVDIKYSSGFTEGYDHPEYYKRFVKAKIAPCPSGAVIPDSFRLFEALESMAVPIADERVPNGDIMNYWDWLFDDTTPFPHLLEWDRLHAISDELLEDWPRNMHQVTCWWIKQKRKFAYKVINQLNGKL